MADELKIGIVGFDTSHATAFTKLLNDPTDPNHIPGTRVIAGYPSFSEDVESSRSRVENYTRQLRDDFGLEVVTSLEDLVDRVDAVLLESVDGRRHLAEATPFIKAGKPLFIDKPFASSYREAAEIVKLAEAHNCPISSSSSLRYDANIRAIKDDPELGEVLACDVFSPAALDPSNPGLFWYGIHAVEILYTFMGPGCEAVTCHSQESGDVVLARWKDGRNPTLRGTRAGTHDYGATVFATKQVRQATYSREVPMYAQLLKEVVPFLQGGAPPVNPQETLEMMAFIQAALLSSQEKREVRLDEITG